MIGTPTVTRQTVAKSHKSVLKKAVDSLYPSPEKTENNAPKREIWGMRIGRWEEVSPQLEAGGKATDDGLYA